MNFEGFGKKRSWRFRGTNRHLPEESEKIRRKQHSAGVFRPRSKPGTSTQQD